MPHPPPCLDLRADRALDRMVLAYSPRFRAVLDLARQQIQAGEGIEHDDFWSQVDEPDEA